MQILFLNTQALLGGLGLWAILLGGSSAICTSAQSAVSEYEVKATLLFNFSQFVEWPAAAVSDTNAPFVIGILGQNPFGSFLDELVADEKVQGKPIVVRRFARVEEANAAHILFISRSEQAKVSSILAKLRGKPILTVGEASDRSFARQGGMIGLVTESGKVRLRINVDAAKAADITVSTKLLRIAEIVRTEDP